MLHLLGGNGCFTYKGHTVLGNAETHAECLSNAWRIKKQVGGQRLSMALSCLELDVVKFDADVITT